MNLIVVTFNFNICDIDNQIIYYLIDWFIDWLDINFCEKIYIKFEEYFEKKKKMFDYSSNNSIIVNVQT